MQSYIQERLSAMFSYNLKKVYIRETTANIQIFFLLKEYAESDENFWSAILSDLNRIFGVCSSADDERYWKELGGDSWGYKPLFE